MKLKLFKKYFFITISIVILSLCLLMTIISVVLSGHMAKSTHTTLAKCCEEIAQNFSSVTTQEQVEYFFNTTRSLSGVFGADIFITDSHGAVLVCACDEWKEKGKCLHSSYIIPNEVIKQASNEEGLEISSLEMYTYPHYVAARAIDQNGDNYVFATAPLSAVKDLMQKISKIYYLWALIPIFLMFVAIYVITYRLTKPIKNMSEAARLMSKGDFSKRIPITSDDEIGELATSFNMMTNSLARLESMRRSFVGNVSHELKTPMTTIGGFIDGILDGTIAAEDSKHYLEIVSEEVKRLSRLVNAMLSMSRLESGEFELKPEKFDFYKLLCGIVIGQERRIEENNLDIIGLDTMESSIITADKDFIHQVVYNLVDNAIKFTDNGGKIEFKLEENSNNLIFTITNTGKGIPEKELPFIFDRFYKADKARSAVKNSTGLGLYIVKTIVSAHKGNITVTSKENQFTTFTLTLKKEI